VRVLQLVFGTDVIPTTSTGGSGITRFFPNFSSIVDVLCDIAHIEKPRLNT